MPKSTGSGKKYLFLLIVSVRSRVRAWPANEFQLVLQNSALILVRVLSYALYLRKTD